MRSPVILATALCAVAALSFSCKSGAATRSRDAAPSDRRAKAQALEVDGQKRRYYLHIPPGLDPGQPAPLVIALHGGGARATSLMESSGLNALADREGFVVAYPEAVSRQWNNGSRGGTLKMRHGNADDVRFISELIDRVASEHGIDRRRVFATGMSMGAMMCYRLACQLSDRIAAVAPVAGPLPVELKSCKPSRPVPILAIHGTKDPIVPYGGGSYGGLVRTLGEVLSAEETIRMFARLNGCGDEPERAEPVDRKPEDKTRVLKRTYTGCREGASVELLTVEGGGHVWPGGRQYMSPRLVGRVTEEVDAGAIWKFFQEHPLPEAEAPSRDPGAKP